MNANMVHTVLHVSKHTNSCFQTIYSDIHVWHKIIYGLGLPIWTSHFSSSLEVENVLSILLSPLIKCSSNL